MPDAQYGLTVWLAGQLQRPDKPSLVQELADGDLWGLQQGPPALRRTTTGCRDAPATPDAPRAGADLQHQLTDSSATAEAVAMTHCTASPEATSRGPSGGKYTKAAPDGTSRGRRTAEADMGQAHAL